MSDLVLILSSKHSPWGASDPNLPDMAAWWLPNRAGYTHRLADAGHYTREEAEVIVLRGSGNGMMPASSFIVERDQISTVMGVVPWSWAKMHLIPDDAAMQREVRLAAWEFPGEHDLLLGPARSQEAARLRSQEEGERDGHLR